MISIITAAFLVCLAVFITWETIIEKQQRQFNHQSSQIKQDLQNYLSVNETLIRAYQAFFHASDRVTAEEFHLFTTNILASEKHIRAVVYAEKTPQETNTDTATRVNSNKLSVVYSELQSSSTEKTSMQTNIDDLLETNHIELSPGSIQVSAPLMTNQGAHSYFITGTINQPEKAAQTNLVVLEISPAIILQHLTIAPGYSLRLTPSHSTPQSQSLAWTVLGSPKETSRLTYTAGTWSQQSTVSLNQQSFKVYLEHSYTLGYQQIFLLILAFISTSAINILIWSTIKSHWQRSRADAANHAKSEFLAIMSHEIRTPLNGVMGMADLLHQSSLPPTQKQYVNVIINSGKSLLNVINDVLDFSQIEAGALKLETIDFSLEQLIAELAEIYRYTSIGKDINFTASINPSTPPFLTGDPSRLRQILLNLLSNAFKFTEQGEIILRVESEVTDESQCNLAISVSDTGIGIRHQQRLFRSFSQASNDTYRKYGGTGLGLSICKQLIEIMDGTIDVVSELGRGSCFTIKLALPVSQHCPMELINLNDKKLLIVDDYSVARNILAEQAKALGMKAITASSANEAWIILASHQADYFDFIITDLDMPHTNGLQFSKQILGHTKYNQILILLLSATNEISTKERKNALNLHYVGSKPTSVQQLSDIFQHAINKTTIKQRDTTQPSLNPTTSLNVLVAEDNPVNAKVIQAMLSKLGHKLQLTNNGEETLEYYQQQYDNIDLILMDCEMPIMNGFLASEKIRLFEKKQQLSPKLIIALTAHALPECQQRCYAAGMDGFLTKPLSIDRLTTAINDALTSQTTQTYTA
ncbi:MAG: response regulator [Spongiibacteraceae bacterium]